MALVDRGSRKRVDRDSDSSLSADLRSLESIVRRTGVALERMLQLVCTKVTTDEDLELAEELRDELKPLIDAMIHFEVP